MALFAANVGCLQTDLVRMDDDFSQFCFFSEEGPRLAMDGLFFLLMSLELMLMLQLVRIHGFIVVCLFQDISNLVTRLAAAVWRILLIKLLIGLLKQVNVVWLIVLVALGYFLPGCTATEIVRGVCGSPAGGSFLMLALLSLMVLPLICLPMGDGDMAGAERLRSPEAEVFRATYDDSDSDTDESEEDEGGAVKEGEDVREGGEPELNISRDHAKKNYRRAGIEIPEVEPRIREEDYAQFMDPAVVRAFEEVVLEAELPYRPVSFQRVGAVALGGGHNVIMVIGTGEGTGLPTCQVSQI